MASLQISFQGTVEVDDQVEALRERAEAALSELVGESPAVIERLTQLPTNFPRPGRRKKSNHAGLRAFPNHDDDGPQDAA